MRAALRSMAAAAALAAGVAATPTPASAGTLQLRVTDRDGQPVPDVVVLVAASAMLGARPAPEPVVILQEKLRFVPFLTVVSAGSTLRFVNRDGYDHHVRSVPSGPLGNLPSAASFELRLDPAPDAPPAPDARPAERKAAGRSSQDVQLGGPGPIGLGCHLHSSMRGQVYVSSTPWFGKTGADGSVRIADVPDGAAELTLWHPDQLQEQAPLKLQIAPGTVQADAALNFTPRRRRP